jgi:hypothetical protein
MLPTESQILEVGCRAGQLILSELLLVAALLWAAGIVLIILLCRQETRASTHRTVRSLLGRQHAPARVDGLLRRLAFRAALTANAEHFRPPAGQNIFTSGANEPRKSF